MIGVHVTGLDAAIHGTVAVSRKINRAIEFGTMNAAQDLRKEIIQGINKQAPGGKKFKPLSPMTLAIRKAQGFGGKKVLLRSGFMRGSINVKRGADRASAFVGIARTARTKKGEKLVNIAAVHEFGFKKPKVIKVTQKMRNFFMALYLGGFTKGPLKQSKRQIVLNVPARPFLRPAQEVWAKTAQKKFRQRMSRKMFGM